MLLFFLITPEQVWVNCDDPNNNVLLAFKQLEENYEEKLKYVIWKKNNKPAEAAVLNTLTTQISSL